MASLSLELPLMYGDHHVINVRQILLELEGVKEVYASSGFQVLEVEFDGRKTSEEDLTAALEKAGYTGDFNFPEELSIPANEQKDKAFFRHSEASEQTGNIVGFEQTVKFQRSPLWPCPGMGPLKPATLTVDKENTDG
jgi:copper chaperone CopZ